MKKKGIVISTIVSLVLILGTSMAWFSNKADAVNKFKMGTVEVEVLEPGFTDVDDTHVGEHNKNVQVRSNGTKKTYVRVRLIPQWSNPSLPVSNVNLNVVLDNWVDGGDGYYYFIYYLEQGQETSLLLESIEITELGPEYKGETLTIKVVAEGVQISNNAWKEVWGRDTLPFEEGKPWTP